MEDEKLKELEEERRSLMFELYLMEHKQDVEMTSPIDNIFFIRNILRDWRFWMLYESYRRKFNDDITIEQFFKKEITRGSDALFKFIVEVLMDLPEKERPQSLYLDEDYPFKFEIIDNDWKTPSFNDFDIDTSSRMMNMILKNGHDMTSEDIKKQMIRDLTFRINLKKERLAKKQAKEKPKKIKYLYKYDKDEHLEKIYKSRAEACEKERFTKAAISQHLKGLRKTLNGFIYKEVIKEEE